VPRDTLTAPKRRESKRHAMLGQPVDGRGSAWFARIQNPMLFWVLPCQAQG